MASFERGGRMEENERQEEHEHQEEQAELMLDDDMNVESNSQSSPYTMRNPGLWPSTAIDKLCAMDVVDSMLGIKYSMYGVFEDGAETNDLKFYKACKASNCVPVPPLAPWGGTMSQSACQLIAMGKSHPFYAYGEEDGKLRCYTFAECAEGDMVSKPGFSLYKRPPSQDAEPKDSFMSCQGEATIKAEINAQLQNMPHPADEPHDHAHTQEWRPQATALRAFFHDAHDFNSLKAVNKNTNEWEHVTSEEGYAGVDGCLYDFPNAEIQVDKGNGWSFGKILNGNGGVALYNFNLERTGQNQDLVRIDKLNLGFVRQACYNLCCDEASKLSPRDKKALCGEDSCDLEYYRDKCYVDVMTLGSLLIIENNGGNSIPMTWGRKQGDCRKPFKNITLPDHLDARRIAQAGASLSSFGKAENVFNEFKGLGMNKSEATALMGAHSYGKLHKYTGGMDTRNRGGGFCVDPTKIQGFYKDGTPFAKYPSSTDHLDERSTPKGACAPNSESSGAKVKSWWQSNVTCWTNERGYLEPARHTEPNANKFMSQAQNDEEKALSMVDPTWTKGGFWDRTPNKLDNDYFKLLDSTSPNERKNCCGPHTEYGCGTDGNPMQDTSGAAINGCDINWCMRSGGTTSGILGGGSPTEDSLFPDYAVLSTKDYVQSTIGVHHLYRLAADWALIDDDEAKAVVSSFAKDDAAFQNMFAAAWSKVINWGHPQGTLGTCVPS